MAASNTDRFKKSKRKFETTVGVGGILAGGTTLPLTSVTGLDTSTAVTLVVGAGTATEEVITGVVSGSNLINCVRGKEGTTDSAHSAGETVNMYFTETHWDDAMDGILVDHDQSGQHKNLTDANGNEWIKQTATASAVNEITVANAATGSGPVISATGGDTNINIKMTGKGTGKAYADSIAEYAFDFIVSGMVWSGDSYGSTLAASMTAGYAYISGVRVTVAAVTARAFTASKDTYIDLGSDGTLDYTEVANNAASPALAADHIRVGIIVSGASNIAAAGSVNQGEKDKVLPIASSIPYAVTDSLGNLICPRDPNRRILGYKQRITIFSATTEALITGLSAAIIIPPHRRAKVTIWTSRMSNDTSGNGATMNAWDGTVGSGTKITAAGFDPASINNAGVPVSAHGYVENNTASAASKTINVSLVRAGAGTATLLFTQIADLYATLTVELV